MRLAERFCRLQTDRLALQAAAEKVGGDRVVVVRFAALVPAAKIERQRGLHVGARIEISRAESALARVIFERIEERLCQPTPPMFRPHVEPLDLASGVPPVERAKRDRSGERLAVVREEERLRVVEVFGDGFGVVAQLGRQLDRREVFGEEIGRCSEIGLIRATDLRFQRYAKYRRMNAS